LPFGLGCCLLLPVLAYVALMSQSGGKEKIVKNVS